MLALGGPWVGMSNVLVLESAKGEFGALSVATSLRRVSSCRETGGKSLPEIDEGVWLVTGVAGGNMGLFWQQQLTW